MTGEAVINGVRMTEAAMVDLLFQVFWKQTQELQTHAQCMEAAEKAAWWLIEVGDESLGTTSLDGEAA